MRVNVWRDWGAEATTTFGVDPVPLVEQATRLEFAGGVTAKLTANWSLYAQGGYQFAAGESTRRVEASAPARTRCRQGAKMPASME